jgi:acyl-coenzyme A synthetase/AMP-(fatty) acid ligase
MVSSGSTGANKHVLRSGESINHMCLALKQSYGITVEDVLLDLAPPHHIIGSGLVMLAAYLCTTIVLEDKFIPAQTLEDIQRHRVSMFVISPFIFDMLSQTAGVEQYDLSSLRLAISVGAPLTEDVYRRVRERCNIPLHELYGSTEATIVTFRLDSGNFEKGMVGIPTAETTVKIFDENYNELPVGRIGTIAAASPMVVKSYFNGSAPTRHGFNNEFLCIGDQGFLDEHGRVHVTGRSNLIINVGGRKVDISAVENVLNAHPGVVESGVYGVTEGNTEVVAAAVVRSGEAVTADELMRWCRTQLSAYKVPKRILFVNALPRHQTGKLMRHKLPQLSE